MAFLIIFAAKYLFSLSILIGLIFFFRQPSNRRTRILIFALISLVLTYAVALLAKHIYYNPRPFVVGHFTPLLPHAADNGFPSDHVLLVSAIASVITYYSRRYGLILWIIVIGVALGRVYAGLHHFSDVLGSILISLIVTFLVYWVLRKQKFIFS